MLSIQGNQIIFRKPQSLTIIEPYGPDCVRVRTTRNSTICDESWTLLNIFRA